RRQQQNLVKDSRVGVSLHRHLFRLVNKKIDMRSGISIKESVFLTFISKNTRFDGCFFLQSMSLRERTINNEIIVVCSWQSR
ncbi:MAG: hypothetical protein IKZ49_03305, partial [Alphaproteobacteria bacterium]|nr:hypothetical protein [Alphaproteobacteria bacterium]